MNVSKLRLVPLRSEACLVPPAETVNTSVKRPFVTLLICFLPLNYYSFFSLSLSLSPTAIYPRIKACFVRH